jgi:uncharacterized protein YecE (DUF72 family)
MSSVRIGCAGWSIPGAARERFPGGGSYLGRYASQFSAVEINSSFYKPHRPATYHRWAEATLGNFRFSIKAPKQITHQLRLQDCEDPLASFRLQAEALGNKLGPVLVQLPPSLAFDGKIVRGFFDSLRDEFAGDVVCEPRHLSWFAQDAERLLTEFHVGRVAADPAIIPIAALPGGWPKLAYFRLHGSPRVYYSAYEQAELDRIAEQALRLAAGGASVWIIFDNTAAGAACANALALRDQLAMRAVVATPN